MAGQESNPVSRMVNVPLKELLEVIQGQQRGQQQEALQNQIKQQEKRMEKIEEMLQQLVQQVGNSAVLGRSPLMTTSVSKNATSEQSEQARDTSNLEVQTRWKRAWKFIVWKITERGEMWDDDLFNIDEEAEDIILERLTSLRRLLRKPVPSCRILLSIWLWIESPLSIPSTDGTTGRLVVLSLS